MFEERIFTNAPVDDLEQIETVDEIVAVALKEIDSLEAYVKTHERIDHQTQADLLKWLGEIKEDVEKATK